MGLLSPTRDRDIPQPSSGVWPGLAQVPRGPAHARIAAAVIKGAIAKLPISMVFPDGTVWGTGGPELNIVRPDAFFARLGRDGLIGFGEAWMTGDMTTRGWIPGGTPLSGTEINEATDVLAAALTVMAGRMSSLVPKPLQKLRNGWQMVQPPSEENTVHGSVENIHRHYDLSNELFSTFLDDSMMYSSAWYDAADARGGEHSVTLEAAQERKIDGILDLANVQPGMHILEIGSGWGGLAIRAVQQRGVRVTTLTLSVEQKALAEKRIAKAGLTDKISVLLEDYRDHRGTYDAVVSVEMIEAVGEKYWSDYFQCIDRLLVPGGKVGLQAITIEHERLLATRNSYTWVHKYVFPGGVLPSLKAIDSALDTTTLRVTESRRLGLSYAKTLQEWRHRFNDKLDEITALGFDETFVRMWNFYLAYTEAGFAAKYIDDWQLGLSRD
ncbi:class I SAM-dependent methyltransferase [Nakamurella antarctica]|uniref:Class I SAM-dependent methyltransferase n=1 Tax=Nakamurella antarctica TaxID=1902245 RepID=A0A3G8ZR55_9ACTN|nr:cyclopropane-fatty-acyl-phospholipid synthase family protein [Nakamurella antarctica]AZI57034.1 class I SAM-dependent methyltransferase [Nakamurella antarctica]